MWLRPSIVMPHEDPGDYHGYCGADQDKSLGEKCSCPDPIYLIELRALTGETRNRSLRCACCDLPFRPDTP